MGVYVYTELIKYIGVTESIVLSQIHYWCDKNKKNHKGAANGYYWCKRSSREFAEKDFEGINERTIRRCLKKLQDLELIVVGKIKRAKVDNTNAYRVDYERVNSLYGIRLGRSVSSKREPIENADLKVVHDEMETTKAKEDSITIKNRAGITENKEYINLLRRIGVSEQEALEHYDKEFKVLQTIKRFIVKKSYVVVKRERVSYEEMIMQIRLLKWEHIQYIAERLEEDVLDIHDVYKYTMSIVYDATIQKDNYYQKKYIDSLINGEEYEINDKDLEWLEKN